MELCSPWYQIIPLYPIVPEWINPRIVDIAKERGLEAFLTSWDVGAARLFVRFSSIFPCPLYIVRDSPYFL